MSDANAVAAAALPKAAKGWKKSSMLSSEVVGGKKAVEGHKLANAQISKLFFTISYKITQIELGSILKKEVSIRKYTK